MTKPRHARAATFIVRLWAEDSPQEEAPWRGEVEHVQSSERRYVSELAQIVQFIEERFGDQLLRPQRGGIR